MFDRPSSDDALVLPAFPCLLTGPSSVDMVGDDAYRDNSVEADGRVYAALVAASVYTLGGDTLVWRRRIHSRVGQYMVPFRLRGDLETVDHETVVAVAAFVALAVMGDDTAWFLVF
ncbi:hypothetical protein GCM10008983_19470 [Lentibacillus halophilus]|uniref:Uncharacterized protein n=1 Tax=Lentibacillus halophilus TaxID=295065 RepID=A0ABP3J573_9BACI